MELNYVNTLPLGGFNYDNCLRNKALEANPSKDKKLSYTKTGTTICGIIFDVSMGSMLAKNVGILMTLLCSGRSRSCS